MSATLLEQLWSYGVLSALDYHFARSLEALGGANEETLFCAALASRAVQLGHVCLDVTRVEDLRFADRAPQAAPGGARAEFVCPPAERLLGALRASPLCGDGAQPTPLVLDARGRLYLQRYAQHERELAAALLTRARPAPGVDPERLGESLRRRFPRAAEERAPDQRPTTDRASSSTRTWRARSSPTLWARRLVRPAPLPVRLSARRSWSAARRPAPAPSNNCRR